MIAVHGVSVRFGERVLFEDASLQINDGDRFALVGPNGSGKSTLFKLILGETVPDGGEIQVKKGMVIGYLPQENAPVSDRGVLEEALEGMDTYDGRLEARAKSILMGLGFRISDFTRPLKELSGGWAMRVAMARLLLREPDVLLLDEPTNHLDLMSLLWFRGYLQGYRGTLLVISHDRAFIDTVCDTMVSVQDRGLRVYRGDYGSYLAQRASELERLESSYEGQQRKLAGMQEFVDRNRARLSTAKRAQSMKKKMEKVELIRLPDKPQELNIRLPQPARSGKETLALRGLDKSYGETRVFRGLDFTIQRGYRMAFVGANGAGKSTLLKIMAGVLPFEAGERVPGHNVVVGYHSQHRIGSMDMGRTVLEEASSANPSCPQQTVRTVLGSFLFPGDDALKPVGVLSGGEKSRLSLVKVLLNPPNLLLLDEPTTHLDVDAVQSLIEALKMYEGTLAFISHDMHFINSLAEQVVYFHGGKVSVYPGNFDLFQWSLKKKGQKFI